MGNYCLLDAEFQSEKMKKSLGFGGGDGLTTM